LWKGEEYSNVRRGEIFESFYLQGRVDVDVDVEDVGPDDKKEMGEDEEEEEAFLSHTRVILLIFNSKTSLSMLSMHILWIFFIKHNSFF
jgi:hypothetical protein